MNADFIGEFPYELLPPIGQLFVTRFAADTSEPPAPTVAYRSEFVTERGTSTNFGLVGELLWLRISVQVQQVVRDRFQTAFTSVVLDGLEFIGEPTFGATIVDGQSELESATRLLNVGGSRSLPLRDQRAIELATIPLRVIRGGEVFAHLEAPDNREVHATRLWGVDDALEARDIVFTSARGLAETLEQRLDVNRDGAVSAMAVLAVINALNLRATPIASGRFLRGGTLSIRPDPGTEEMVATNGRESSSMSARPKPPNAVSSRISRNVVWEFGLDGVVDVSTCWPDRAATTPPE